MRAHHGLRLLLLSGLTAPLWLSASARADCGGPTIRVVPARAQVEDVITVVGEFWTDTCDDVGGVPGGGCFSTDDGFDEGHPIQDIELTLRGKGVEPIELGTVDANDDFAFRLEAALPLLEPGGYRILARSDHGSSRAVLRVLP